MSNKKESVESGSKTIDNSEAENNELPHSDQEIDKNPESKKRKLHKTYITGWKEDINRQGFARCLIASCNFMSSNVLTLQSHHKICDGIPVNGEHLCNYCWTCLSTEEELVGHKIICKKAPTDILKLVEESSNLIATNYQSENWTSEDEDDNQGFENSIVEEKLSEDNCKSYDEGSNFSLFCCIHCRCGFPTKEDHIKHQENCSFANNVSSRSKKPDNLHFRVIKQMKSKDSGDDCIIQPGPELAEGEYRRRRAYRAEHKNSWAIALEKYKYVKCLYQNCYFIAMSLEDMIAHYGYCNGDGSFAKFVCLYCNGRVTSEAILLKHIERSHYTENAKVEPLTNKIGDENTRKSKENFEHKKKPKKAFKGGEPLCHKIWQNHIKEHGYGYCRKSLCNFMASDISELENHLKTCDGAPNFDLHCCQKCSYRLPTRKELVHHIPFCNDDRAKYFLAAENQMANSQPERMEEDDFEIGPVLRQYESKRPKSYTKDHKSNFNSASKPTEPEYIACESTNATNNSGVLQLKSKGTPKCKGRGRPKKNKEEIKKTAKQEIQVTCAKCQFQGSKSKFIHHNFRVHVGLGWIVGEEPVDLNDEKLVIRLVKEAFKYTKKAVCEKCDDIKRSVLGFVSHIQNCGKSEEEKNALKVQCPHCEGKYLKYSLSTHIKLTHSAPEEKEEEKKEDLVEISSGKRRSAVKAVSKFQQALTDNDEPESNRKAQFIFFEKSSEKLPKLNSKLNNLWYKLKRDKKKIPCRHPNCHYLSDDVKEAKNHHYRCPLLPDKVFLCELCDFYSIKESVVQLHVKTHRKYGNQRKLSEEEVKPEEEENEEDDNEEDDELEEEEEDEEGSEEEDFDEFRKRKKKSADSRGRKKPKFSLDVSKSDFDFQFRLKQNFCRREKIDNIRGIQFFSSGLDMTLQEDLLTSKSSEDWQQLHTTLQDWCHAPDMRFLPKLAKSISVRLPGDETNWRRFERLESDLIGGIPVMFTGGSVRSMSWCKTSCKRMMEKTQKQYLAVTTAKKLDHLKDIHEKSLEKDSLLQIWDCGNLNNDLAKNAPKFSLGIVHPGGEVWDMKWFPQDTYAEGTEERLTRLGLLATACEDGVVRIWSVCDPQQLKNTKKLPIYKTDPVVTLVADEDINESCFQLSVGLDGIIAGGFANGNIAVWNLKNIFSPFCKKLEKCRIIRAHLVFQAHKTAITALTFCPLNSRYLSTAGLDRFVKMWDLEFPCVPVELFNKEYSLDNIWTMNWPSIIYNFDGVVVNFNKGAVKFIKNIFTDRHQSTFAMKDICSSLSFSDWLNALCGGSITGEVKLRLLKNLIHDQKRSQSTISSIHLEKLENDESEKGMERKSDFPKTYSEVVSGFGLAFKDNLGMDDKRQEKPVIYPEEFPIRAVNKIAFNPNFESFTHIALGYNCGLIRIQPLKELQLTTSLKLFLGKARKEKF